MKFIHLFPKGSFNQSLILFPLVCFSRAICIHLFGFYSFNALSTLLYKHLQRFLLCLTFCFLFYPPLNSYTVSEWILFLQYEIHLEIFLCCRGSRTSGFKVFSHVDVCHLLHLATSHSSNGLI